MLDGDGTLENQGYSESRSSRASRPDTSFSPTGERAFPDMATSLAALLSM